MLAEACKLCEFIPSLNLFVCNLKPSTSYIRDLFALPCMYCMLTLEGFTPCLANGSNLEQI